MTFKILFAIYWVGFFIMWIPSWRDSMEEIWERSFLFAFLWPISLPFFLLMWFLFGRGDHYD